MRINYVMVDLENVKPHSFELLDQDHFKVMIFVGSAQSKVSVDFAESLQRLGNKAEYVRIDGNGKNALDFHIAYHIGRLAVSSPEAYFHIISRDAGFDPLIAHLRSQKIRAGRTDSIDAIPIVKAANAETVPERLDVVRQRLIQLKAAKPRKVATLSSTIASLFQKQLSEQEVKELLDKLEHEGTIIIKDARVSYALDHGS